MELKSTKHNIFFQASQKMSCLNDNSIDLVVTSPPYPMIEMWDCIFVKQNRSIQSALDSNNGNEAFELIHKELDSVWNECFRVLKNGAFLCINIGDATRTINGNFSLYNNHSRIITQCSKIGFTLLPGIIWRKQTNAPNKFMGSGMMPCGAYVTLEHEWILIFRKGGKRPYNNENEKTIRRKSSFFWEERNIWFSDLWEIKGVKQAIFNSITRERSAAFPLSIPYRLINMYSQIGDTVLDPFLGLGTTSLAAILTQRNSIGLEIDSLLEKTIKTTFNSIDLNEANYFLKERYNKHLSFVKDREALGKEVKYINDILSCKVMTKQEIEMTCNFINSITEQSNNCLSYTCTYGESINNDIPYLDSLFSEERISENSSSL